jgi:hypothetical protein
VAVTGVPGVTALGAVGLDDDEPLHAETLTATPATAIDRTSRFTKDFLLQAIDRKRESFNQHDGSWRSIIGERSCARLSAGWTAERSGRTPCVAP